MILDVALPVPVPKTFDYLPVNGATDELIGSRVKVAFGPRFLTGVVVGVKESSDTPADRLKKAIAVLDEEPLFTPAMIELARWLARRTVCSLGEALDALLPPGTTRKNEPADPSLSIHFDAHPNVRFLEPGFELTHDQKDAVGTIHQAIYGDGPRRFLLRGVSAAGKTEVYMAAIKDVLDQGKTALYLIPEIGLATFIAQILKDRFGRDNVCLWHSEVSLKERRENWWKIKRGEFPIVIGTRSAALLPLAHLGLIVMDEEHDTAWKEDRKPRFDARQVALERATLDNAMVIFGSATPTLEILNEAREGRVSLVELNERVVQAAAPTVRLIDMKTEKARGILSPSLEKAIGERLKRKEQAILFVNRRGFHRYLKCPSCDWTATCAKCGIALVKHKNPHPTLSLKGEGSVLICHYCQSHYPIPAQCPQCGHKKLFAGGTGTQRVVEEIGEKFPWAHAARWDRDAVKTKEGQEKILDDFRLGALDILIGTQIVAQGFHFPKVTLVGVIDADSSLYLPDFRAAEHTFQLITQVAGRAGRELVTGEVLIQTKHPDHPALQKAAALDVLGFMDSELHFRRDLNYPPFAHIVSVETVSKNKAKAEKDINQFAEWASALALSEPVGVLGPSTAKRKRKGVSSFELLLKIPDAVFDPFLDALNNFYRENHSRFRVDVDPV